jgi:sulfatase maturation enzyme AslB (radical SAM superfamily)
MDGNMAKDIIQKCSVQLERLNVHSHHGCNLRCSGCNHHSEYIHVSETIDIDEMLKDLHYLLNRVTVKTIHVLGGEPLLNPEGTYRICDEMLNRNQNTKLITNGIFLDKNTRWVIELLQRGLKLKISLHLSPEEKGGQSNHDKVQMFLNSAQTKISLKRCVEVSEEWKRKQAWFHVFKYEGERVYPFNDDKNKSFDSCVSNCPQLYKGRLFKCAHSAYFKGLLSIKNQLNDDAWKSYIDYSGYDIYNDAELEQFLMNVYEPEDICSSCPAIPNYITNNQDFGIQKHRIPAKG